MDVNTQHTFCLLFTLSPTLVQLKSKKETYPNNRITYYLYHLYVLLIISITYILSFFIKSLTNTSHLGEVNSSMTSFECDSRVAPARVRVEVGNAERIGFEAGSIEPVLSSLMVSGCRPPLLPYY